MIHINSTSRSLQSLLSLLLLQAVAIQSSITETSTFRTNASSQQSGLSSMGPFETTAPLEESSCAYHDSCSSCIDTTGCHWCEFDHSCHVKGSLYGCLSGVSQCPNDDESSESSDSDVPDEPEDKSCFSKKTCGECSNTYTCHWCEFDNACHLIGSVYGCVSGVSCYNNDRCQRKDSEPIPVDIFPLPESTPDVAITWTEFVVIIALSVTSLMGLTCLYCSASIGKDIYDDFTVLTRTSSNPNLFVTATAVPVNNNSIDSPKSPRGRFAEMTSMINESRDKYALDQEENEEDGVGYDYDLLLNDADEVLSVHEPLLQESNEIRRGSRKANFLFGCCRIIYLLLAAFIVLIAAGGIALYPQYPEYNVCSDEMDWKSIVDGMSSMKMEAGFQILISVSNPNKLDAVIDMGSGSFKHDGVHVGTFEIPEGVVLKRMAITDYLINVNITPDKWQALELTSEYYKGTLSFIVEAEIDVTIPALGGYTFQTDISNYMIHVGDAMSDRHLCACKEWKGDNPSLPQIKSSS